MEYAYTDYNGTRPHSSIDYLPPDEFERRWNESADFRNKFLEERKKKEVERKCLIGSAKKCSKLRDSDHT